MNRRPNRRNKVPFSCVRLNDLPSYRSTENEDFRSVYSSVKQFLSGKEVKPSFTFLVYY